MVERRRRELDLSPGRRRSVFGNHPPQDLELYLPQHHLVGFLEPALLADQPLHSRVAVQIQRIDPRQLVPDLQVEEVPLRVPPARIAFLQKLCVTRTGVNHPAARRVKELR